MHHHVALSEYTLRMPIEISPLTLLLQGMENMTILTRFLTQIDKFAALEDSKKNERPKVPHI